MAASDAAILQEIARISGAINRAKAANQDSSSSAGSSAAGPANQTAAARGRHAHHQPHSYGFRGGHAYRGRGGSYLPTYPSNGPYRGSHALHHPVRGGARQKLATHSNNTWTASSAVDAASSGSVASIGSKHKTLVLNNPTKDKSVSPATADPSPLPPDVRERSEIDGMSASTEEAAEAAVDSTKAVTDNDVTSVEKLAASRQEDVDMEDGEIDESTLPPPEPKKPAISLVKKGNEIIINGVTFVSDASGRKLVRKDSSSQMDSKGKGKAIDGGNNPSMSTPSKTSVDGQAYVRTKSGNLISTAVLKKRQALAEKKKRLNELVTAAKNVQKARQASARAQRKKTPCRYFQKTGACARAKTCPYMHDSDKVAICPRFLRNSCPLTLSTCPLSHSPNAHRMPQCQHYPNCRKGDSCPYTHVQVSPDAKICKDFVGFGWCEKGDQCPNRHVWECPDFEEKGVCNKKGCKLGHVIRRKTGALSGDHDQAQTSSSFMFVDTNPDPSYVRDDSIVLPESFRKRSASVSVATSEDYSSGEEEAANLVKKKVKIVSEPKDAMEANEDFVTLDFGDLEGGEEDGDYDDSEAESGLEEEHLDSISRRFEPMDYQDDSEEASALSDDDEAAEDTEEESVDIQDEADMTFRSTAQDADRQRSSEDSQSDESATASGSD